MPTVDRRQLMMEIGNASKLLRRHEPRQALEIAVRYPIDDLEITGPTEEWNRRFICAAFETIIADAHWYMNKPAEAAEHYRRSCAFANLGQATRYARVVVQNRLKEHYASAYECADRSRRAWHQRFFLTRWIGRIIIGFTANEEIRQTMREEDVIFTELKQLAGY